MKTAWVYAVAIRMGFDVQEALSMAHVYVHLSSLNHALMLGNILNDEETKAAQEELSELPGEPWSGVKGKMGTSTVNSSQPWVDILKAK